MRQPTGCIPAVEATFDRPTTSVPYDTLLESAYEDPRIIERVGDWVECMRKQGYDYDDIGDPILEFEEAAADVLANSMSETGVPANVAESALLIQLQELQDGEIVVAVASQTCGGSPYENQELLEDVIFELRGDG